MISKLSQSGCVERYREMRTSKIENGEEQSAVVGDIDPPGSRRPSRRIAVSILTTVLVFAAAGGIGCSGHASNRVEMPAGEPGGAKRPRVEEGTKVPGELRSANLRLPRSTSTVPWDADRSSVRVTATLREIRAGGETVAELPPLREGPAAADSSSSDGGPAESYTRPLLESLQRIRDTTEKKPPTLRIAADRMTPYRRFTRVLQTAGEAGFESPRVVVTDRNRERAYQIQVPMLDRDAPTCRGTRYLGHLDHHIHPSSDDRSEGAGGSEASPDSGPCAKAWSKVIGHEENDVSEPPQVLVSLGVEGIDIYSNGDARPPIDRCADDGPTLCLQDDSVDMVALLSRTREFLREPDAETRRKGAKLLWRLERAYDWRALYQLLREIHRDHPAETVVYVTAPARFPLSLVVRLMDVARYELRQEEFATADVFWEALWSGVRKRRATGNLLMPRLLFSDPVPTTPTSSASSEVQ